MLHRGCPIRSRLFQHVPAGLPWKARRLYSPADAEQGPSLYKGRAIRSTGSWLVYFGKELRLHRERAGVTQTDLAERLGWATG
ncbi:MAG: helix-turn-helix domain-containing protein [Streptosporangiales bacterium]|nr:helix-turn-helix domain-containing protein [Streptosporangiales bacterium]MBO0890008.1 helix-turn-helix domain-containing protein [Acidothermales bacterium]